MKKFFPQSLRNPIHRVPKDLSKASFPGNQLSQEIRVHHMEGPHENDTIDSSKIHNFRIWKRLLFHFLKLGCGFGCSRDTEKFSEHIPPLAIVKMDACVRET